MTPGEKIALSAMKKELARLTRAADKAKREADECCGIGSELIAIHEEFVAIVKSDLESKDQLPKLNDLQKRSDRAERIRKKDLMKLLDKENSTRNDRDAMAQEISILEFRHSMRKTG